MYNIGTKPDTVDLNQLDAAILMEKYIIILSMINYGSKAQKEQAKREIDAIDGYIHNHVNAAAFEMANRRLQFTEEELEYFESAV